MSKHWARVARTRHLPVSAPRPKSTRMQPCFGDADWITATDARRCHRHIDTGIRLHGAASCHWEQFMSKSELWDTDSGSAGLRASHCSVSRERTDAHLRANLRNIRRYVRPSRPQRAAGGSRSVPSVHAPIPPCATGCLSPPCSGVVMCWITSQDLKSHCSFEDYSPGARRRRRRRRNAPNKHQPSPRRTDAQNILQQLLDAYCREHCIDDFHASAARFGQHLTDVFQSIVDQGWPNLDQL